MIFFNNQLMKSERQMRLFMVDHPKPFERYEDHAEALKIQLKEMVEKSAEEGDNPIALMEGYLETTYPEGHRVEEIAHFLTNTPQMQHALHQLQDNWMRLDETLPEDSLLYGGTSKEVARQSFTEMSLHTYLEALAGVYNDPDN